MSHIWMHVVAMQQFPFHHLSHVTIKIQFYSILFCSILFQGFSKGFDLKLFLWHFKKLNEAYLKLILR